MARDRIRFYLQLLTTGSSGIALYEQEISGMTDFVNQTFSQLDKPGDREYETEELYKFDNVAPGTYRFGIRYEITGSATDNIDIVVAPDNNTDSYIQIDKVNQAADQRVLDVPANMPFATDGVLQEEFIKGLQKKYNLVIYPSKTKPKEFVIETYNDYIKNYRIRDWNNYVDLSQKMEVIPTNNQGYKKLEFGDKKDEDYAADQFNKENNREFSKIYYTDTQNFYSQGEKKVETNFGVSPLVYVQGTGLSGSIVIATGNPLDVKLGNTANEVCGATAVRKYIAGINTEIQVGDIIYDDVYLTQPTQGYTLAKDDNLDIKPLYTMDQYTGQIIEVSSERCGGLSP